MDLLLIALLLAAVGAVVVVALGKVGGGLAPVQPDAAPALDGPLSRPADLDQARFTLAVRGYRMDQVDAVLDETRDLLAAQDEEIDRLRRLVPADVAAATVPTAEPVVEPSAVVASTASAEPSEVAEPAVRPVVAPVAEPVAPDGPVAAPDPVQDQGTRR